MSWHNIGTTDCLVANSGVCALVKNQQVAIFYLPQNKCPVFAVGNYGPIASPLYKKHFCLETGQCPEDESIQVPVFDIKIEDGNVFINAEPKAIAAVA